MAVNIGLSEPHRQGVVGILSRLLADEYLLYTKTRNYHWNVVGPQFNDLHKFFEAQYEAIDEFIDEVAERPAPWADTRWAPWPSSSSWPASRSSPAAARRRVRWCRTSWRTTRRSSRSSGRISRPPWTSTETPGPATS